MLTRSPARALPSALVVLGLVAVSAATAEDRATSMRKGASGLGAPPAASVPAPGGVMQKLGGNVWVEGPGFDITYGKDYDACAARCVNHARCVMIEYYRPEKKCNLYDAVRPRKQGGSSIVSIRGS